VVGGTGFSMFPWEVMERSPEIDLGVFLEAEESFPELLENLGRPETVAGVFYRKDGQVLRTGCRTPPNVSKMPAIDMSFVDLAGYTAFPYNMGVQTKRGCILDCAYCSYPALNGRQLRLREPGQVVDEIDELVTRYGLKTLSFLDSVFNIPQEHCVAICQELIRRRVSVKWYAWFNCREFSEDLFALALRAGCEIFCFSPDAYTARGLEALQKQLCRQDIRRIVKMFERYRGPARLSFNFFGSFPGMRLPDLLRTLAFSMEARARLRGRLHAVGIEHIRILPGTAVHRLAMEKGVITPETNLLPENVDDYGKLFYREPNAWFADFLFRKFHVVSEKWFG
jgi:anaerobic magnesium-protoporphyrin IX monomethyl ester cyclase